MGLIAFPAQAEQSALIKLDCVALPNCRCYTQEQVSKIATAITNLGKCEFSLRERERLIEERFIRFDGENIAWWQEPNVIWGGVAISFSVGMMLTFFVVKE